MDQDIASVVVLGHLKKYGIKTKKIKIEGSLLRTLANERLLQDPLGCVWVASLSSKDPSEVFIDGLEDFQNISLSCEFPAR